METNKEQHPRPKPWFLKAGHDEPDIYSGRIYGADGTGIADILNYEDDPEENMDMPHIIQCVNQHEELLKYKTACEGINPDDPLLALDKHRETQYALSDTVRIMRPVYMACLNINPDNPMAVAESLGDIVKFMNEFLEKPHYELGGMKSWASYLIDKITDKK